MWSVGGARRTTADLYNAIVALSQLSYSPLGGAYIRAQRHLVKALKTYIAFKRLAPLLPTPKPRLHDVPITC